MPEFHVVTSSADTQSIVELARAAHLESRFGDIKFSAAKVERIVERALKNQDHTVFLLASKNGAPVDFACCSVSEYHIGADDLMTSIHNMHVLKSMRATLSGGKVAIGLFQGIKSWSKSRSAKEILLHVTSGVDLVSTHKLTKRMEFKFIGGSYASSLAP